MSNFARAPLAAVLGPTNTGKTHLAVERMMAHASGMIGFPLRLLAREVYDRVVAAKGPENVALITGEEKILPENARWLLCTAESMPRDRDVAFVALDTTDALSLRIDKFLWFARLARTRSLAQRMAEKGHIRCDGRRIERAHALIRIGNVLSVPMPDGVQVLRIERIPERRVAAQLVAEIYQPVEGIVDGKR